MFFCALILKPNGNKTIAQDILGCLVRVSVIYGYTEK